MTKQSCFSCFSFALAHGLFSEGLETGEWSYLWRGEHFNTRSSGARSGTEKRRGLKPLGLLVRDRCPEFSRPSKTPWFFGFQQQAKLKMAAIKWNTRRFRLSFVFDVVIPQHCSQGRGFLCPRSNHPCRFRVKLKRAYRDVFAHSG